MENSIDGDSSSISVTFTDSGRGGLEISDDGCGIQHSQSSRVATKGGTSKLSQWDDMTVLYSR